MALTTGFQPEVVRVSIDRVKSAYAELIEVLGGKMQTEFVAGMADKWACTDAVNFFNQAFKPTIDSLIKSSNTTFESVVVSMNSGAYNWAVNTGDESAYQQSEFEVISKEIDASIIQNNIGGVIGIDLVSAQTVASKLPLLAEEAKTALVKTLQAVQDCGFIGGNQASNLINSLNIIKNNIDKAVQDITSASKKAIEATIQKYSDTEGRISQAFAGEA